MPRPSRVYKKDCWLNDPHSYLRAHGTWITANSQVWTTADGKVPFREDGPAKITLFTGMDETRMEWWSKNNYLMRCNLNMHKRYPGPHRGVDA